MCLFALAFFYYFFGGSFDEIMKKSDGQLLAFVGLFFTSPVVGLIVATFAFNSLNIFSCGRIQYYVPTTRIIIRKVLSQFRHIRRIGANSRTWSTRNVEEFMPLYQILARRYIKETDWEFLERRWAVIWILINTIASIILAFIVMSTYFLLEHVVIFQYSHMKAIGLATFICYCAFAVLQIYRTWRTGAEYEFNCFISGMRECKGNKPPAAV